eukprot:1161540-Pelagomonas_calceolata.AAC.14
MCAVSALSFDTTCCPLLLEDQNSVDIILCFWLTSRLEEKPMDESQQTCVQLDVAGEAIERIVTFQPPISGPQNLNLTARTLAGRTFNLPATAFGVQPTLRLSHNKIEFPATPVNDETSVSVVLYNTSGSPQAFEFGVPPDSGLKFHPHVGEVPAGSSLRIQVGAPNIWLPSYLLRQPCTLVWLISQKGMVYGNSSE